MSGHGPGRKDDGAKIRTDLLPIRALLAVAEVMTFGASKYGANNWQNVKPKSRYFGAALRHLFARALGELSDPETGLPHLAHASCCVLFLLSGDLGHDPPEALEPPAPNDPNRKSSAWEEAFGLEDADVIGARDPAWRPSPILIPHPDNLSGAV